MFDTVFVKKKLPMPDDPKGYSGSESFQTKDFSNFLLSYAIEEDGSFWILQKEMERIYETKTFSIYDFQHGENYDYWIEYSVSMIDGFMKDVFLTAFEATDNSERKKQDELFEESLRQRREFVKTKRFRYLYHPYNKIIAKIFSFARKIQSINLYKLETKLKI